MNIPGHSKEVMNSASVRDEAVGRPTPYRVGYGRQEDYLSVRIHSFTIYRRSRNPRPSKIAGIAFSIRAVRVPDCLAPAK